MATGFGRRHFHGLIRQVDVDVRKICQGRLGAGRTILTWLCSRLRTGHAQSTRHVFKAWLQLESLDRRKNSFAGASGFLTTPLACCRIDICLWT